MILNFVLLFFKKYLIIKLFKYSILLLFLNIKYFKYINLEIGYNGYLGIYYFS